MRPQAVPNMARLVRDPLLVDGVVDPRQDAHHLTPARIHPDGAAERVHHVDRQRLGQLPGARREGVRLRGERADRAEIDDIAGEVRVHAAFEIGGDLHVLAAADGAKLLDAPHFGHEADAARAVDAAVHVGVDQGAEIFLLHRALIVLEAAGVEAIGHGLVLQIAFAALVADRAIERVIDQQEFEHAFARFLHLLRIGDDGGRRSVARGQEIGDTHGAGGNRLRHAGNFDQAHAAIAGDRQALVIAEAGNLDTGQLASLDQGEARRDLVLLAVDDQLAGHGFGFWLRTSAMNARNLGVYCSR